FVERIPGLSLRERNSTRVPEGLTKIAGGKRAKRARPPFSSLSRSLRPGGTREELSRLSSDISGHALSCAPAQDGVGRSQEVAFPAPLRGAALSGGCASRRLACPRLLSFVPPGQQRLILKRDL